MRTGNSANRLRDSALGEHIARALLWTRKVGPRLSVFAVVSAIVVLNGCATHREMATMPSGNSALRAPQVSRFGTIAFGFIDESRPAAIGFQKAKGKKGTVKEAIWDSAELGLSGPGAGVVVTGEVLSTVAGGGDPIGELAVAGAVGGVTALGALLVGPAVGAEGLVRSMKKISSAELGERETILRAGLGDMAEQQPFHEALLRLGAERLREGFFLPDSRDPEGSAAADAILEARVDEVRLERAGSTEGSYFLRIKTHVRVVRVADGIACLDQHAEYRSRTALFLDWTFHGSIEAVAGTGYETLAEYYVNQLLR